jgi:hypothetical protein
MLRTILTSDDAKISLAIPETYIGIELEIFVIPKKEITPTDTLSESGSYSDKTPVFGCAKGQFQLSDDFDAPLSDFAEYTQ